MPDPLVSIIIPNYKSPQIIDICLRTLTMTEGIDYEVIVVDNASDEETVRQLRQHKEEGRITTLVEESVNHMYSGGCNIGVQHANPASTFFLLLNSDIGFLRPDWLVKLVAWAEGTIEYKPAVWGLKPATPDPGPRDIVSAGFSWDTNVLPSLCRPEGFCLLIRRSVWRDMSMDLPWHGGMEEAVAQSIREGAKCGVLSQYPPYFVHREGASGTASIPPDANKRKPDIAGWFSGLRVETLDFYFGPDEHDSYLSW